jgi:competence ComEA-like helix-hairpin-helix protein
MGSRSILAASGIGLMCSVSIVVAVGQDRFPDGPGKAEMQKVCSGCHDVEIVLSHLQTPAEWADTFQKMVDVGAEATQDEWRAIEQYIDANLSLIAINKSPAAELQVTMNCSADVAAAIVKRRQESGPFKSIDDVKNVAGVDAAKVDAWKSRFVF